MKQLSLIPGLSSPEEQEYPAPLMHTSVPTSPFPPSTRRLLGAYYSPHSAADFMAEWCLRRDGERILEPSFGEGVFLRAIAQSAERKRLQGIHLIGVEIGEQARTHATQNLLLPSAELIHDDFLNVAPEKVQGVIGNPPYVRLRRLARNQQQRTLNVAQLVMKEPYDPSGSLWGPFLLHALRFLDVGGRLAFVLPYEFTYVRYARPLWKHLGASFGSLRVLRTHERLFPELLQDVVILLADEFGSHTHVVRYQTFEQVNDLLQEHPLVDEFLRVEEIVQGKRTFLNALLDRNLRELLETRIAYITAPARQSVTFNIGYVAGDKSFFHPTSHIVNEYDLPMRSLKPALFSTRALRGEGLYTAHLNDSAAGKLFLPDDLSLTEGEREYILLGEKQGVSTRYKCRVRRPWYRVPGVRTPDVIVSVFSDRPIVLINDGRHVASNSLLCGYLSHITCEALVASWYTSLTLLQCEIEVHALGGGVMIMVPREAGNIRLLKGVQAMADHLEQIDHCLRRGKTDDVYRLGDSEILMRQSGLSKQEVELIHQGIETLKHWRTSAHAYK